MSYEELKSDLQIFKESSVGYFDLKVVESTHIFIQEIYKFTKGFPTEEKYGLTSQLRRAATSINLNIIEGKYRSTRKEFIRFLEIARGSCAESHYLIRLSKDMGYLIEADFEDLTDRNTQIWKMLNGLISHFKKQR